MDEVRYISGVRSVDVAFEAKLAPDSGLPTWVDRTEVTVRDIHVTVEGVWDKRIKRGQPIELRISVFGKPYRLSGMVVRRRLNSLHIRGTIVEESS